ncbi:MAG TPA: GIY-YIG nuclease family protein [Longimicrobium sp.]|nr:GIY-YIG nuclease family protein [Longimicrobium sp.]
MHNYYVYILASETRTLCVGMTRDLVRRVYQHKYGLMGGFAKKYRARKLVHYEHFFQVDAEIAREKQLKGWLRKRKMELVEEHNPGWLDLSDTIGLKME